MGWRAGQGRGTKPWRRGAGGAGERASGGVRSGTCTRERYCPPNLGLPYFLSTSEAGPLVTSLISITGVPVLPPRPPQVIIGVPSCSCWSFITHGRTCPFRLTFFTLMPFVTETWNLVNSSTRPAGEVREVNRDGKAIPGG